MEKVAIFVDVQNIYYTCKQAFGRSFNYRALYKLLSQQYHIEHAIAYAIAPADDGQRKFQDALKHIGFEVKLKPYIQRSDGSAKGDWDVGITIDILDIAEHVDKVILLSGDGDFDLLLAKVAQKYGCNTQVISVAPLTAKSLLDVTGSHIAINHDLLL
ncbi:MULTISPECIES: NYN domain-containing protein [unclassified Shewanella]|uniref:LabA-like NYN domain-containing protein n=1 Tax=unclassified Shewanella TaxID=196818 RepID=UPI000C836061|nr:MULTISPECIES: NYN domain-containing protein [unclassified Shewanella]MDO6620427.1 NYN domain-containing protein [Shewanella sp. 6_MG-2023]MDO6640091.1 NYN domain-containing protein [Shewanella sp. 5_MG-2023]MDO6774973.1 NYN domain-containing protein [Shewanella sp. 3_MG-2023]PMG26986.1 nuclease [Shewanella sp. 10N.286.52.C2]PMG40303.1 nuclease [Shewanella sp. 10N.286.52.B9]